MTAIDDAHLRVMARHVGVEKIAFGLPGIQASAASTLIGSAGAAQPDRRNGLTMRPLRIDTLGAARCDEELLIHLQPVASSPPLSCLPVPPTGTTGLSHAATWNSHQAMTAEMTFPITSPA